MNIIAETQAIVADQAGAFSSNRIWINNDLIDGWTSAVKLDETNRTIMVS